MILVTGGTGFIGSHLLDKLSRLAISARCLLRRRAVTPTLPRGIDPCFGDLTSGQGIEQALDGIDTVIHLAGTTKALRVEDYYTGNSRATTNLSKILADRNIRLVHVSS